MQKAERNYGIDLLRVFAMFMIVILHVLYQGGILPALPDLTLKGELAWALEILCYCAVNCYALISGYVGLRARHRGSQIISLWLQVLFYSVLGAALSTAWDILHGQAVSFRPLIKAFFPVLTTQYWYFTAYFALFFFIPILNFVIDNAPRAMLKAAAIPAVVLFSIASSVRPVLGFELNNGYSFLWLMILYLTGGYIAKYGLFQKATPKQCFLGYFSCAALLICSRLIIGGLTTLIFGRVRGIETFIDYVCILTVLCGIFLVCGFSRLKIGERSAKLIRFLSPAAFGVYLAHLMSIVWGWLAGRFAVFATYPAIVMIALVIAAALGIFAVCAAVELLRQQLFKLLRIRRFADWLEAVLGKLTTSTLRFLRLSPENEPTSVE